mmetsp:Transcript_7408/g.20787  ORF Transcript_7408/g.20787 Transcript_7408/m.20787 type:complete len:520 (-) Transcript_7408:303-1862(-)
MPLCGGIPTVLRINGHTGKVLTEEDGSMKDQLNDMMGAATARELLDKWAATPYDDDDGVDPDSAAPSQRRVSGRLAGLVSEWCPKWWPGVEAVEPERTDCPDDVVSFGRVCTHAAVVWLAPLAISALATPFVSCESGSPVWAYVLTVLPGIWAVYDEAMLVKDMTRKRYEKTVRGRWFQNTFDFQAKLKERQFFTYGSLPVKGVMGSLPVLLFFSVLDWFDLMAKWSFVISSHRCARNLDIDETFGKSFFSVPIVGGLMVQVVQALGVSGMALILFVVFVVMCQGCKGFWQLYQMWDATQTSPADEGLLEGGRQHRRTIACLEKAAGFASLRAVQRMLNDVALEQELALKERLDQECSSKEAGEFKEYDGAMLMPATEDYDVLVKMRENVTKVINAFFWNMVFVFGVRIIGENILTADLQASYLGLMWEYLSGMGIAKIVLSVLVSAMCAIYKLVTIIELFPRSSKDMDVARYLAWGMLVVSLLLAFHIMAKIVAAKMCTYHLLNLSQFGCFHPASGSP